MPSSDPDSDFSDSNNSSKIQKDAEALLRFKPGHKKANAKNNPSTSSLRDELQKCFPQKLRQSKRLDSHKAMSSKNEVQFHLQDIQNDIASLSKKFDTLSKCLLGAFEKIDHIEFKLETVRNDYFILKDELIKMNCKIENIEASTSTNPSTSGSYADVAATNCPPNHERLDRLEYRNSEEERMRRSLEVNITHPTIDNSVEDLEAHVREFLTGNMHMENRSIDVNMKVKKSPRENTVQITLSHIRFKRFLFIAKKKLREENVHNAENLYLNEYLTSYNFEILKKLKAEKKRRNESNLPFFDTVYCFEGRIYVKKVRSADKKDAICINTRSSLQKILTENFVAVSQDNINQ